MRRLWLIFSQAVTVALALAWVATMLRPEWLGSRLWGQAPASLRTLVGRPWADAAPVNLVTAARRASPSVVSVVTHWTRAESSVGGGRLDRGDDDEAGAGMGSAVIVSRDGYLLTNFHVVDKAQAIEVALVDGRRAQATIVGSDPETDLAVLKIDVRNLPAIAFGQPDRVQVGDPVLAIGNPFNVGQTVTSGIVSALGRSGLGLNTFENFIQTDAAINPGNSGGALVDGQGRLLGINTAIYSRSGGSLGIGFAIPASTARQVLEGLVRDGVVTRGWIGVQPTDLTPETAQSLQLAVDHGVLISGVLHDGPARQAGVQPGDVVTHIGDVPVLNTAQLLNAVAALRPDSEVRITVQRQSREVTLAVQVGQRPAQRVANASPGGRKGR